MNQEEIRAMALRLASTSKIKKIVPTGDDLDNILLLAEEFESRIWNWIRRHES